MDNLDIWKDIKYRIKEEGFHYCFKDYSSWDELDDNYFHSLVNQYLDISKKIEELIDIKIITLQQVEKHI